MGSRGRPGGVLGGPWGASGGVLGRSWGRMEPRGPPGQSASPHFDRFEPPKGPPGPPKIDPWDPQKVTSTRILHFFMHRAMSKQGSKMGWLKAGQDRLKGCTRDFDRRTLGPKISLGGGLKGEVNLPLGRRNEERGTQTRYLTRHGPLARRIHSSMEVIIMPPWGRGRVDFLN